MCGECMYGRILISATYNSSRCQKYYNVWLTVTMVIVLVGLLLVTLAFIIDVAYTVPI